jgi:predicted type IV restriction endonuclease
MGTRSGVPDLLLCKDGKFFALELKGPRGTLSDEQIAEHAFMRSCGITVAVAASADEAINVLQSWGVVPDRGGARAA